MMIVQKKLGTLSAENCPTVTILSQKKQFSVQVLRRLWNTLSRYPIGSKFYLWTYIIWGVTFSNFLAKKWSILLGKNIQKSGVFGQKMTSFCFCSHSANFCPIFFWRGSLNGTGRQGLFGPLKQKNLRSTENWGQHPEHETFRALYLFSGPLGFFGWLIRGF